MARFVIAVSLISLFISVECSVLKVGVPWRLDFTEFTSVRKEGNNFSFGGYCVEAFRAAIGGLDYPVDFEFVAVGDGVHEPDYNELVKLLENKKLQGVAVDITINSERAGKVEFTTSFMIAGLIPVVTLKHVYSSEFTILFQPFTWRLWLFTLIFYFAGPLFVCILERRRRPHVLCFEATSWFNQGSNGIQTKTAKVVAICWLIAIAILFSTYTANLSAILYSSGEKPSLNGITSIIASNAKVGVSETTGIAKYLENVKGIPRQNIILLANKSDFYRALSSKQVKAVVDEKPYLQSLITKHCSQLELAGDAFLETSWGFGFIPEQDQLARDLSASNLNLSKIGVLEELQMKNLPYKKTDCQYSGNDGVGPFDYDSFLVLFAIPVIVAVCSVTIWSVYRLRKSAKKRASLTKETAREEETDENRSAGENRSTAEADEDDCEISSTTMLYAEEVSVRASPNDQTPFTMAPTKY